MKLYYVKANAAALAESDGVAFDDRIGQKLFAHFLNLRFGGAIGDVQFDDLAFADALDAFKSKCAKRMTDRLALWVQNAVFQHDSYGGAHR